MGAASGTKRRIAVAPRRRRRRVDTRAANKAIAAARNLTNQDFVEKYIQPCDATWPRWTHRKTREQYVTSLRSPEDMQDAELEACFGLVERTSSHDYRRAAGGWHPEAKRAEMRSPGLRYILVRGDAAAAGVTTSDEPATENSGGDGEICAFTSFMPTWEDNKPVVYCYEIHLLPELEGTGLGRLLMSHVTTAADRIGALHKTMLTCFTANTRARRFYENLGFAVDDSSPRPRRLRDKVVEPEYVILYRPTRSDADADVDVDVDAAAADEGDERQEKRAKRVD
ncbi:Acyl-CoA N-acyltransferase [Beauveria brongniartii RCEF 3172]|uniref:N-alpha-acetyltransferase 40 n=1 Tax=Beauveria brongniartii RCEF 3172 TaxID=1081107 RepID=A0A167EXS0_9HYPO|nr:Acyl-CoA N-acyltransferase [Beauveria brongniartii RCEF 3172]